MLLETLYKEQWHHQYMYTYVGKWLVIINTISKKKYLKMYM